MYRKVPAPSCYILAHLGLKLYLSCLFLKEEAAYIKAVVPQSADSKALPFPPLCQMLMSPAVISLIIVYMASTWGYYTLFTGTPTYLNNIQHFSLETVRHKHSM